MGVPMQGFYTEEVRIEGKRTGFDVVSLSGNRGKLARVRYTYENLLTFAFPYCKMNYPAF